MLITDELTYEFFLYVLGYVVLNMTVYVNLGFDVLGIILNNEFNIVYPRKNNKTNPYPNTIIKKIIL